MAGYAELTIDQGSTFDAALSLVGDDGVAIDLSGCTVRGQIRKAYTSANAAANIVCTITDAVGGNVDIGLSAATTANIKFGRYVYDIEYVDTFGTITRIVEGIVTVTPEVTR
jgi:hypothetical protein